MKPSKELSRVVRTWSEVFMHRSLRDFRRFMRSTGLSFAQVGVLMRLYHCESSDVSGVGTDLGVTRAAASQVVERLVQMGLVQRSVDPADRRGRRLVLTASGRLLMDKGLEARTRWVEQLAESLSPAEHEAVARALELLTTAATRLEAPFREKRPGNCGREKPAGAGVARSRPDSGGEGTGHGKGSAREPAQNRSEDESEEE